MTGDARELMLRPGTPGHWYFAKLHNMLMGPQLLVLQVAHPMVGAGVLQHSNYQDEPWRRLVRTAWSLNVVAYGDPDEALAEVRRLRTMHASIKGTDDQGRRYHALHPEAYAWVHATLVRGAIDAERLFGNGIPPGELDGYYQDLRRVGLLLGLRDHQLPRDVTEFDDYYDQMVRVRLEDNQAVRDVLASIRRPARPTSLVPEALWWPVALFLGDRAYLVTVGTLPDVLRERLGLTWSAREDRRLRRFARQVRWAMPLLAPVVIRTARFAVAVRQRSA